MDRRERWNDAKQLSLIAGCTLLALMATGAALASGGPEHVHTYEVAPAAEYVVETPLSGSNRLYGQVVTVDGQTLTGFLRWDRNEGSLTDLLDATKAVDGRRGGTLSGIRFGHVQRIDVTGRNSAEFTLRSGQRMELGARASDLGTGMRALMVDHPDGSSVKLQWRDLESVEFLAVPRHLEPAQGRLHGTLTTRSGEEFTGYVVWDVDEIYTSDILDGDHDGVRQKVPFGAIETIERHSASAALVTLHSGAQMMLRGTNDVNRSNSGIAVSDPGLGQVMVDWSDFAGVRFHGTADEARAGDFDGGRPLQGTVWTRDGESHSGLIRWDRDEAFTWELLHGDSRGVEFQVEFGKISRITRMGGGALVTLTDGRSFNLRGSNDVSRENRGIEIQTDDGVVVVDWDEFDQVRLAG